MYVCKKCKNSEDFNLEALQTSLKTTEEIGTVQLDENGQPDWETFEPRDHFFLDNELDNTPISREIQGEPTCEYCGEDAELVTQMEHARLTKEWEE